MTITRAALLRYLIALIAGALVACAFAPLGWWPLAILGPAVLMVLWQDAAPRHAAWLGFWFNAGTFGLGAYWLYISIHDFGPAPIWLSLSLVLALVAIMGLYHALLGYIVARWLPKTGQWRWLVAIPAAWLLIEWWRGWFLSGFAWLSLGYSQTDTWLARLAPILGVYGLTVILLLNAGALASLALTRKWLPALTAIAAPWLIALAVQGIDWTHASGKPVNIAIVQGAIPQDLKWAESHRESTLRLYRDLTEKALGTPLVVWPEAAPPDLANYIVDYLRELYSTSHARGTDVVLGVARASDDMQQYYNSVLALGEQVTWYDKRHLVPFGEFFPVPAFVRSWLRLQSLPYSDFTHGADSQPPLPAGGLKLAATICYDDAYGSSLLESLKEADTLINVTNDAWFGHSSARHQHFQIARMRAIETGRYLIRAANDGISAVIGPRGEVVARAPEYQPTVLRATVVPRLGLPPYAYTGNWLIILLATAGLTVAVLRRNL